MSELENKLGSLLSDPGMLEKLGGLLGSLGAGKASEASAAPAAREAAPALPDGLDPGLTSSALKLLGSYGRESARQAELLRALKPYVNPRRAARIDRAVQIMKMAGLASQALNGLKGEGDRV